MIHHPDDRFLSHDGEMHEGTMSTSLGMKGVPDIAELQMLQRDMLVLEYHSGQIIEHAISSARSVSAIEQAKNQKQDIKATVSYMNLLFTDENLSDFDSNLKVLPVLRSENDRAVLIEGVKSGIIDAIVSNHKPLDEESKNLEFTYAQPGATGIENCLPALVDHLADRLGLDGGYCGPVPTEIADVLDRIDKRGSSMAKLILDVLRLERLKTAGRNLEGIEYISISSIIDKCVEKLKPVADARQVELILSIEDFRAHGIADQTEI